MGQHLPDPRVQTGAWSVLAVGATIVVLSTWPLVGDTPGIETLLGLGVTSLAAAMFQIETQLRDRDSRAVMGLNEAALVLLLLTVPPGWAWLLTVMASTAAAAIRRRPPLRILFNHATWSVSLAVAIAVDAWLRPATTEVTVGAAAAATGQPGRPAAARG